MHVKINVKSTLKCGWRHFKVSSETICSWQQKAKLRSATQSSRKGKQWRGPRLHHVPNAKHKTQNGKTMQNLSWSKAIHSPNEFRDVQWSYHWTAALSSRVKQRATKMILIEPRPRTNCHTLTLVVWAGEASNHRRCQSFGTKENPNGLTRSKVLLHVGSGLRKWKLRWCLTLHQN